MTQFYAYPYEAAAIARSLLCGQVAVKGLTLKLRARWHTIIGELAWELHELRRVKIFGLASIMSKINTNMAGLPPSIIFATKKMR